MLVYSLINSLTASDLCENGLDRRLPYKGLGVGIGRRQILINRGDQLRDTLETSPPYPLLCQLPEPPLYQVQPRRTRRREVQRKPRVLRQPRLHLGLILGPIVVHNQVQRRLPQKLPVQPPQEAQELLVPVLGHALAYHPPVQDVEGREQGGGPMPFVVVGHGPAAPLLHGQAGLGALEGLDLALLVHAQDHGLVGRIEVQPHHVGELLREPPVFGELEPFRPVGLQPMGRPDTLHGCLADALGLGHGTGTPVGRPGGLGLCGGLHHLLHTIGSISHSPAPASRDLSEGTRAALQEALAPEDNGGTADTHLPGDPAIGQAVGSEEADLGPDDGALRGVLGADPGYQGSALIASHRKGIT